MPDSGDFLPYGRQVIDADDVAAVAEALRGDWLTTGPLVDAFEAALAERVGAKHAIACSSGTAALHLTALALRLGPGHAVIVPAITFLATANAARFVGAEVVFADVDAATGRMRPEQLERALADLKRQADRRHEVKAVFPVHLAGPATDLPALAEIARCQGLSIVEDACHALGGAYVDEQGSKRPVGGCAHGDMAIFSFHPVKAIAMGEGGAVTTNDATLQRALRRFRNHGMVRDADDLQNRDLAFDDRGTANPWYYEMPEIGFNYRLSDIHCALGLSQLGKLDRFVGHRASLADRYDAGLAALSPTVQPAPRIAGVKSGWHLYPVRIDVTALAMDRAELMRRLQRRGIGTQVHYIPLHRQPYYRNRYGEITLPGAEAYYSRTLSLPLHGRMAEADVDRVIDALADSMDHP